jgi:hypothetical protein
MFGLILFYVVFIELGIALSVYLYITLSNFYKSSKIQLREKEKKQDTTNNDHPT